MARKQIGDSIGISIEREKQTVHVIDEFYTEKSRVPFTLEGIISQAINTSVIHPLHLGEKIEIYPSEGILSLRKYRVVVNHLLGNLIGIEYVKTPGQRYETHGSYIQCLEGKISIILQKSSFDHTMFAYEAHDTYLVNLSKGLGFIIPPMFEYTVINTQLKDTVFVEIYNSDAICQNVFENHKGAAYYVIHKNSKKEVVRNPYFKKCTPIRKINISSLSDSIFTKPFSIPMLFQNIKNRDDDRIKYLLGEKEFDLNTII